MTQQERRDLIQSVLDHIDGIVREVRASTAATTAADNSLLTATAPIRQLVDSLDAAYAANRTAYASAERAMLAALSANAATVGLLRRLTDDAE